MSIHLHLLLATIPSRRLFCERLLVSLPKQSLVPDFVHLVLDGYFDSPTPVCQMPHTTYPSIQRRGPGGRWRVLPHVPKDAILIVLDDDQEIFGPDVIKNLVSAVDPTGAAALSGTNENSLGGSFSKGRTLISMGAAVMALHVADLAGLSETLAEIRKKCDFDPFADLGDDEAVISAHLWKRGVPMRATGPLAIRQAFGSQVGSQFSRRRESSGSRSTFWQREAIAKATGWPWKTLSI